MGGTIAVEHEAAALDHHDGVGLLEVREAAIDQPGQTLGVH
jgi:hypothetical protein